jgi:hypothetical protein
VPEADGLLARFRDGGHGAGEPAHVSLIYPFVRGDALTPLVLAALRERFGSMPSFDYELARAARFLDVVFIDPQPSDPFRDLVRALGSGSPPYDAGVTDIVPHLTVLRSDDPGELDLVGSQLDAALPIACRATEAWLVVQEDGRPWSLHTRFPLAAVGVGGADATGT